VVQALLDRSRGARGALAAIATTAALLAACDDLGTVGDDDGFTVNEWQSIRAMTPLATPMRVNPYNWLINPSNWLTADGTQESADEWARRAEAAAKLGQMLFFDPDFSGAVKVDGPTGVKGEVGKVSCVTCHDPNRFFIDSRTAEGLSHGVAYTARSSPTMVNLGWYEWVTWAGRLDSLAMQGANAPEAPTDVGSSRLLYAHVLYRKYRDEYNAIFPTPLDPALDPAHPDAARFPPEGRPKAAATDPDGPWETMMTADDRRIVNQIMANCGKALEAYERKLVSSGSPFERFARGEKAALDPRQKSGLKLFVGKAACVECHTGPVLSDNKFHNVGVPQTGPMVPPTDGGRFVDLPKLLGNGYRGEGDFSDDRVAGMERYDVVRATETTDGVNMPVEKLRGRFRTAGLLSVSETAPYFHDGSMKTLADVVRFYNRGGGDTGAYSGTKDARIAPLGLTEDEEADLVSFLRSLTGNQPPEEWRQNTAKPHSVAGQ
jgi:cytochrome c peroxidase